MGAFGTLVFLGLFVGFHLIINVAEWVDRD